MHAFCLLNALKVKVSEHKISTTYDKICA